MPSFNEKFAMFVVQLIKLSMHFFTSKVGMESQSHNSEELESINFLLSSSDIGTQLKQHIV